MPTSHDDSPVPDLSGHWEVDYARSDSVQTQLNASFREVQRELRRRREAAERGASYQGPPMGDLDTLVAVAKMAELVTEPELLEVYQDVRRVRIERENSFALSCELAGRAVGAQPARCRAVLVGWAPTAFPGAAAGWIADQAPVRAIGRWLLSVAAHCADRTRGRQRYGGGQNLLPLRPDGERLPVHGDAHPWARLYH